MSFDKSNHACIYSGKGRQDETTPLYDTRVKHLSRLSSSANVTSSFQGTSISGRIKVQSLNTGGSF